MGAAGASGGRAPVLLRTLAQFERDVLPSIPAQSSLPHAVRGFFGNGGRRCYVVSVAETMDSLMPATFHAGFDQWSGLRQVAKLRDASLICAPDVVRAHQLGLLDTASVAALQDELVSFCEMQGTVMAILDPPSDLTPSQVHEFRSQGRSSKYAALYYPWVRSIGHSAGFVPPSGHVAGLFAWADSTVGPHSAPLQVEIRDVAELAVEVQRDEIALLWPSGINSLAASGSGLALHSARTLSSDPDWRQVSWVRTIAWIVRNVSDGMGWASRINAADPRAWRQFGHDLEDLFDRLWRGGALLGATREQAYRVRCDRDSGTPDGITPHQVTAQVQLSLQGPLSCAMRILCQLD